MNMFDKYMISVKTEIYCVQQYIFKTGADPGYFGWGGGVRDITES